MEAIGEEVLTAFLNEFRPFPDGLTPETIEKRTGIRGDLLPAVRERLEDKGFAFAEDEEGRWRLSDAPDRLWPFWIRAGLRCDRLAHQIFYKEEVESTQDIAFELMVEGRTHGTMVVAEHQTGGRGRGDRTWVSAPGKSVQFSLLLDLEPPDTFASVLTIAIATAIARGIQDVAGLPARIKFPNDILVRGKKVAGILLEVRDYGLPGRAVAGIGINVNQLAEDFPEELRETATSLREASRDKEPIPRPRLLRYVLRELENWLDNIAQGEFDDLEAMWKRFSAMEGKEVRFLRGTEEIEGRIVEARIREGLLVALRSGEKKRYRLEHLSELRFL